MASPIEVCALCQGPSKFGVKVQVYQLEDLPMVSYYYELCERCMLQQSRLAKRKGVKVTPCPF